MTRTKLAVLSLHCVCMTHIVIVTLGCCVGIPTNTFVTGFKSNSETDSCLTHAEHWEPQQQFGLLVCLSTLLIQGHDERKNQEI